MAGGGSSRSSTNKLADKPDRRPDLEDPEVYLVSVLHVRSHLPLCFGSHQGDGQRKERRCSSAVGRLELSKFSSMLDDGRWRLLIPMSSGREDGGRWPASPFPSVTFLVERRPPLSSRLGRHRGGSCCIRSRALACIFSHGDFTVPSGSSPAAERFNSSGSSLGLDSVSYIQSEVLLAKSQGLSCTSYVLAGSSCNLYWLFAIII